LPKIKCESCHGYGFTIQTCHHVRFNKQSCSGYCPLLSENCQIKKDKSGNFIYKIEVINRLRSKIPQTTSMRKESCSVCGGSGYYKLKDKKVSRYSGKRRW